MNFFESIVYSLQGEMQRPGNYSLFHIISMLLIVLTTIFICICFKNTSNKGFRIITLICWLIILLFEIYKQIVFSFDYSNGVVTWDYSWYAFPLQLCSTPLYILPLIIFLKDGKFRDSAIAYISTYALAGGVIVFFYPNNVFIELIGINIQTMVHHGIQIVLGIYYLVYYRKKLTIKFFLNSFIIFSIIYLVAFLLDLIVPKFNGGEEFNMFYLSTYFTTNMPILSAMQASLPFVLYFIIYLFGFSIGVFLFYLLCFLIIKLCLNKSNKTLV